MDSDNSNKNRSIDDDKKWTQWKWKEQMATKKYEFTQFAYTKLCVAAWIICWHGSRSRLVMYKCTYMYAMNWIKNNIKLYRSGTGFDSVFGVSIDLISVLKWFLSAVFIEIDEEK